MALMGVMALCGSAAACGGGTAGSPSVVTISIQWSTSVPQALNQLKVYTQQFEKLNPDIKVDVETVPLSDLDTKILTDSEAGTLPDIVIASTYEGEIDAQQKHIWANLSQYMTPSWVKSMDFIPGSLDEMGTYAVPISRQSEGVVFYNKQAFAAAGITPPPVDQAWTWAQFTAAAKKLTHGSQYGLGERDEGGYTIEKTALNYFLSSGHDVIYQQNGQWQSSFTLPAVQQAVQFFTSLVRVDKARSPDNVGWGTPQATEAFNDGKAAMVIIGDWFQSDLTGKFGKNWDMMLFPVATPTTRPTVVLGQNYMNISNQSQHKDDAWKLINFLMQPKRLSLLDEINKSDPPSTKGALSQPFWTNNVPSIAERTEPWAKYDVPANHNPEYTAIWANVIGPALQNAEIGKATVSQTIATINKGINQLLTSG
jgi:multiple sugar transport system substrate-binding protein